MKTFEIPLKMILLDQTRYILFKINSAANFNFYTLSFKILLSNN